MKKVIFLILLFILLIVIAMAAAGPGEIRGIARPGALDAFNTIP